VRHAALAFTTLGWLLETYPSLAVVRDEETASFLATTAEQRALVALLVTLGHHVPRSSRKRSRAARAS